MKHIFIVLMVILAGKAAAAEYNFVNPAGQKVAIRPAVVNGKEYLSINKYHKSIFPGSTFDAKNNTLNHKGNIIKITPHTFYLICTIKGKTYSAQMTLPAIKPGADLLVPLESFFTALNEFPGYSAGMAEKSIVMEKYANEKKNHIKSGTESGDTGSGTKKPSATGGEDAIADSDSRKNRETGEPIADNKENLYSNKLYSSFGHTSAGFLDKLELINKIEKKTGYTVKAGKNSKDIELPEIIEVNREEMSYPPNLYVIPKNLIRRELQEIKSKVNDD